MKADTAWGLLGGTFDPIHTGHLEFARVAADTLKLDRVVFVPAAQNPLKTNAAGASAEQRLAMVQLALEEFGDARFIVDRFEIDRPGPSYTIATLEALRTHYGPRCVLLMGSEVFAHLTKWKNPARLLELAQIAVITRPEEKPVNVAAVLGQLTSARQTQGVRVLPLSTPAVSATHIRTAIGTDRQTQPLGLQRTVWQFIRKNRLY